MQGVLNGAADGFMNGAITGAITGGMQGAASFMKSSKMMGSLDEASQLAKKPKTNPLCSKDCFVAGTMVKTEGGYKAIEEIEVGDKVWSWDEATGEQALKTVVQLFRNTKTVKTKVTIESEDGTTDEIVSTPGHKYYLPLNRVNRNPKEELEHASYEGLTEQWVSANDLKAGDRVVLAQTGGLTERVKYGIVKAVKTEESESYTTYNFEVEDYHTYFVGKTSVCVHNAGCSVNQMNQLIKKGKAPKGVKRIDSPKVKGEQIHAHLDRGSAINIDGTLKHGNGQELTVSIAEWLRSFGWKL